jgi:hypothetical protein
MKVIAISSAIALLAGAAHADPVSVKTPKADASAAEAAAYVADLDKAVRHVCREAAAPVVGLAFYSYLACLKNTRLEVGKQDPTGLYAGGDSVGGTVVAAR